MTETVPSHPGGAPEPSPEERTAAQAVFGGRLDLARGFVGHLASSGIERGLLGPREVPRLWGRHVLNCAVVAELMSENASVVDVGSGAGLPGLAIAIARPDLQLQLVEPLDRRVIWLNEVVADLGLSNVSVHRARAEQVVGRVSGRYVTARAVSALSTLVGWTLPLVEPGGEVLAIKGRSAAEEIEKARKLIRKLSGGSAEIVSAGAEVLAEPTTVVRIPLRSA
ncbi:16S rRNA (guanine(527)-N(7))-methyltransferase RsmG [Arthrobacter sp. NamB2]|uniref:16S rRNA (guanine(527)-N(7))-methyltransferase RsmG n=1 Tax=Arthrobacter sp. NamB2 TaxID=2576035 RepID=UPI0010C974B4|nr:16S rRNA (guanine(527)-N(7))-methyltransferase RsmG [Arthrobacter sp. NamB2]TKV29000.1 16S rRNA (guanine(527)-N(7))-methyltransferase RsmG [Arthrobacter sp. NamB2]